MIMFVFLVQFLVKFLIIICNIFGQRVRKIFIKTFGYKVDSNMHLNKLINNNKYQAEWIFNTSIYFSSMDFEHVIDIKIIFNMMQMISVCTIWTIIRRSYI